MRPMAYGKIALTESNAPSPMSIQNRQRLYLRRHAKPVIGKHDALSARGCGAHLFAPVQA